MRAVMIMTLAEVAPIGHVHSPIRPIRQVDASKPFVVTFEKVRRTLADVTVALALDAINVEPMSVNVAHEDAIVVLGREAVAEVDHAAGMRVSAAGVAVRLAGARLRPVAAGPV